MNGTVLVTGGTRGIGRAVVRTLLAAGRRVAFTYRQREDDARAIVEAANGHALAWRYDLADRTRPGDLVPEIEAALGPIDGLVNNAAIRRDGLLATTADADWDAILDADLGAAFRCCRAVIPGMISRRRGSIVNVSSLTAVRGVAGQAAYGAAKAGLIGMTKSLARELGRRSVRVNAVVPGLVMTEMVADAPPEKLQALRAIEALPSGTLPEDVAATIVFLLSDEARAITGQSFLVDAGSTA
ncbi:MAG TPA: SDR family oxidoreductase [Candidatus Polarisedimenticolaceae bacterium]|nr:SDR family oxidoreductase [Candidatus Polarisedimenticolaceae bacterium]